MKVLEEKQIIMITHYHMSGERFSPHWNTEVLQKVEEELIRLDLLSKNDGVPTGVSAIPYITEKGKLMVEAYKAIPLPIKKWVMK